MKSLGFIRNLTLLVGMAATASAGTADIVNDFSATNNPNGVWSYGHDGTLFTAAQGGQSIGPGVTGWQGVVSGTGFGAARFIDQNASGSTYQWLGGLIPIPNNTLMLDPQLGNVYVVFTAPSSGKYTIDGSFFGDNTSEESHPVMILVDGNSVWSATIATFNQPDAFSLSETLAAGDTVTFEVATGSDGHSLGTGLVGTVTGPGVGTPEPATWVLLPLGIVAFGSLRLRSKRSQTPRHEIRLDAIR